MFDPLARRILPATALAASLAAASSAQTVVFSTTFDGGAPPELSGVTTTEDVQGYAGVGAPGNQFGGDFLRNTTGCDAGGPTLGATTLTLTGLPPHSTVSVGFLLAIIDTWDGLEPCCGPDFFEVAVDGQTVFSESFQNAFAGVHPYVHSSEALLSQGTQLGFRSTNVNDLDTAFDLGLEPALQAIPHTASTLTVTFTAAGVGWHHSCLGAATDESWAIDNLTVRLDCPSAQASETVRLGTPPNPDVFRPGVTSRPLLGRVWDPVVDHATGFAPTAFADFLIAPGGPPQNVAVPGITGTLLCNVPPPAFLFFSLPAGTPFSIAIPNECSLAGLTRCSQGGSISAGPVLELANALDLVLGSF